MIRLPPPFFSSASRVFNKDHHKLKKPDHKSLTGSTGSTGKHINAMSMVYLCSSLSRRVKVAGCETDRG